MGQKVAAKKGHQAIPFDDALRKILSAPPIPHVTKKKPAKKRAKPQSKTKHGGGLS
ncbi:MAG TPA: hypothetical protein VK642_07530 [Burkholderiales bacterium]|nr:hypothetical protein [Burkholderiales bacterium]